MYADILDAFPKRGEQRRRVMAFIRELADDPRRPGDFTDRDESYRIRQVKIIGNYAVTYWVDEAAKAVMVISVEAADRL